jgi:hypothetical protein
MSTTDMIRQQVNFSDDEWKVIQPKLQRVLDAQASLNNLRTLPGKTAHGTEKAKPLV